MNETIKKDYRKKDNLKWLNDNFFIAIYDKNDNYITYFEDIESASKVFNIKLCDLLRNIRKNYNLEYEKNKFQLFLIKKESIKEEVRRR